MKDEIKTVAQQMINLASDRLRNPFFVTFLATWIPFNWKLLLYLILSEEPIKERIAFATSEFLDGTFYSDLWIPILIAASYVALLPYLMLGLEKLQNSASVGRLVLKRKQIHSEMDHRISLADKEFTYEQKRSGAATIKELNDKIEVLVAEKEELQNEVYKLNDEVLPLQEEISKLEETNRNLRLKLNVVTINFATYGDTDVTRKVKETQNLNGLEFEVSNDFFGFDPKPETPKVAIIEYVHENSVKTVEVPEGQVLKIPPI